VGGRRADGEITSFFADDRRDATRRTYISKTALIARDELGYVLQLRDGAIQYRSPEGKFSEISFVRYDLAIERLTGDSDTGVERGDRSTYALVAASLAEGKWPRDRLKTISERTVEGLRVVALCLLVVAIAAFPTGRRREPLLPLEITVLAATFLERGLSTYAPGDGWLAPLTGVIVLAAMAIVILGFRLRAFAPQPKLARGR
jgi:lipopolysaccharide export system permease protein